MKIAVLCDPGCEDIAALEVKELIKKTATKKKGYVVAECSTEQAAFLCYRSQCASRILAVITEGKIAKPQDTIKNKKIILDFDYSLFLKDTFRATCERHGSHKWQAREVEEEIGALLHTEKKLKVDLEDADMDLWCKVTGEHYVVGVDLCGRDLGKREYKAFHTRRSLRGTIAYAAVRAAGFSGTETLVDPFSLDGGIPIEAAMFATQLPVQKYKKDFAFTSMPFAKDTDWDAFFAKEDEKATKETKITGFAPQVRTLKMARGNAKLAGVDKAFTITKCEVNWLDTKFKEGEVDMIVTLPPCSGKNTPLKDVEKIQDDLFYQCRYVLKQGGTVLLIAEKKAEFLNAAQRHKFKLQKEKEVHMGGTALLFLVFGKT